MDHRLGLDVAHLVHPVVHQGHRPDPGDIGVAQAPEVTVEEVRPLARQHDPHMAVAVRGGDVVSAQDEAHIGTGRQGAQGAELALVVGPGLAAHEGPTRAQPGRRGGQHEEIGDRREHHRRGPALGDLGQRVAGGITAQELSQGIVGREPAQEATPGVGVHIDPGAGGGQRAGLLGLFGAGTAAGQ